MPTDDRRLAKHDNETRALRILQQTIVPSISEALEPRRLRASRARDTRARKPRRPQTNILSQVNIPKTRRTYCKGKECKKHTQHKVTQYKAGKVIHDPSIPHRGENHPPLTPRLSGLALRTGKASLRQEAVRLRRTDQARFPQEGQDHQEGCASSRVHELQDQGAIVVEALQALRAGVRSPPPVDGDEQC